MKISTRIQYGLRFMMYLANAGNENYISITDVARLQGIPEKYLENIVSQIKSAGLVKVKRGARGGYKLNKSPEDINLLEIFEALDGEVLSYETPGSDLSTVNHQVFNELLLSLKDNVSVFLSSLNMKTLADKISERQGNQMFYI